MAENAKSGIQVKLLGDPQVGSNGVLVHFAYKAKGGKWAQGGKNFSKALTDDEVMAQIRDFVETQLAMDSVQAPTLGAYKGLVMDIEDLPTRAALAAKEKEA